MSIGVLASGAYKQITASANIQSYASNLLGVFCSSSTAGTLTVYDDAGTGTTTKVVDTFTLVAGTFYQLPFGLSKGLYVVIGGTASVTVAFA